MLLNLCTGHPFSLLLYIAYYLISDRLEDKHVLEFSKRIANETALNEFGVNVLQMRNHNVEAARTNHPNQIQMAALGLLNKWVTKQDNREIAYSNLIQNLQESDLRNLVNDLKEIVEGKKQKSNENGRC